MSDLLKEMERIAKAFQNPDQNLELDMQKTINTLRQDSKLSKEDVEAIDHAMHNPGSLTWKRMPDLPDSSLRIVPDPSEVGFIVNMIRTVSDGAKWGIPSTGQEYRIDKKAKTFTLTRETERDEKGWHDKTKAILRQIGWKMIDTHSQTRGYSAEHAGWSLIVMDFPIDAQEDPKNPGQTFPPGTRGQEAMAHHGSKGVVVRLGHRIGREFIKAAAPDFGSGKSGAAATVIQE
jgi:hypothetical protein